MSFTPPLTVELFGKPGRSHRIPVAVARSSRVAGASFGAHGSKRSAHDRRIESICAQVRGGKKKASRFAWKLDRTGHSKIPFVSPMRASGSLVRGNKSPATKIPFNSSSPKTSWFDEFSKVPENEDESLCHDKLHFTLNKIARAQRVSVFERDRLSWAERGVFIDRSIDRGLVPSGHTLNRRRTAVDSGSNALLSGVENARIYMKRYPSDVGSIDMGHTCLPLAPCTHAVMKSKTKRLMAVHSQGSGLAPPQTRIGKPALVVRRPNYASSAFLSSKR